MITLAITRLEESNYLVSGQTADQTLLASRMARSESELLNALHGVLVQLGLPCAPVLTDDSMVATANILSREAESVMRSLERGEFHSRDIPLALAYVREKNKMVAQLRANADIPDDS